MRVALLLVIFSSVAHAGIARVRWRGVEARSGTAPPRLESATAAHLALALRPLGAILVPGPPFDAEAVAHCAFGVARHADCQVELVAGDLRAQRRSDVPYRDAEDLAESLALLVSGMLQTDFADLPPQPEPEPPPPPKPAPKPPEPPPAPLKAPTKPEPRVELAVPKKARPDHDSLLLSVGPSVAVGFSGEPALWGASVRALYLARRLVRAGGSLTLEGTDVTRGGFDLGFFRMTAATRVGLGITQGRVDVDLTVGPALHLLYGQTRDGAHQHTLTSVAGVAGARLGVSLVDGLALELGLDVSVSAHDERVAAGPTTVTRFGQWWLDLAIAFVYRR